MGSGLDTLQQQLAGTTLDLSGVDLSETTSSLAGGVASLFGSVFSSAAAFVVGTFVAVFFLFYVMADWPRIEEFAARHSSVRGTPGRVVVDEATTTLRRYFGALTTSSLVTAVLIGLGAVLAGLLGAMLSAPVTVIVRDVLGHTRGAR